MFRVPFVFCYSICQEFVPADMYRDQGEYVQAFHRLPHPADGFISRLMAEFIVDVLHLVHIRTQQGEGPAFLSCLFQHGRGFLQEASPVQQSGHNIPDSHLFDGAGISFDIGLQIQADQRSVQQHQEGV